MGLFSSKGFKRYLANTSWMMIEKVVRMTVALVVGVYVARYLGPERFGLLSYAISFVGLFSAVGTLGLDGIVVRNLVKEPGEREHILGSAFLLKAVGGVMLFGLVSAGLLLTSSDCFTDVMVLVIAAGMLFQAFGVIDFYFQANVLAKMTARAQLGALFILAALKVFLVLAKGALFWFAFIISVENALLAVFLVLMYRKCRLSIFSWRFDSRLAFSLLKESWPLMLSGMVVMIYMRIDQVMIKEMLDAKAVGNYAAAVQLSEAWYFIPTTVCASLFPAVMNAQRSGKTLYYVRMQRLYDLMVWTAVAVALPTTFFAEEIVGLIFGNAYLESAGVLKVHVWGGVFVFLGVASGKWLLAENLTKLAFYRTLCGAIMNVLLNLILIPRHGILGAAVSTLLSQFVAAYAFDALLRRTFISFTMKSKSFFPVHLLKGDHHVGPYS